MLSIARNRSVAGLSLLRYGGGSQVRDFAVFLSPKELEQPCSPCIRYPRSEQIQEPRAGTDERKRLCNELATACYNTPNVVTGIGNGLEDEPRIQVMPFEYERIAAHYSYAKLETLWSAMQAATLAQRDWERRFVDERCSVVETAADLIAGKHRQRIAAAAMVGQGMTAIQAEYNICQLVDYLRYGCFFLRDLTRSRYVVEGGRDSHNRNQYHGLQGFWAAITPSDSLAQAAQLAITPIIMGNCVLWKPGDNSVLACHRVFECLQESGIPPGVINFVPAEKNMFLHAVTSSADLAGIAFSGTTSTLEYIWETVGYRIKNFSGFPRIVGSGSGQNFHVVHSSANLPNAVSCTVRAAFEMAGQKSHSCSRVFVAESVLKPFLELLTVVTRSLIVCHPLDYRCFTSSLVSKSAFEKVVDVMNRVGCDPNVKLVTGGQYEGSVGYYVQPTVYLAYDPTHELMVSEVRGPLLTVCPFSDKDCYNIETVVSQAPYALTGSIFATDQNWVRWAIDGLRDYATTLCINDRCSEEHPAQQPVGGTRKSGTGAKAGSRSYLLHFCTERSLRESLRPSTEVTYRYMDETPRECV